MKIALTFSGGGFRAAAFSLGSLSLLDKVKWETGTLLEQVVVLSTVSGGTITGASYALGLKRKNSFSSIYTHLYDFLSNSNLITLALERLASNEDWDDKRVRNLITAFADIYDKELFSGAKFGELMTDASNGLHHTSFNSTEFSNALQFRFQWSEKILRPESGEPDRGIIGNNFYRVPMDIAENIRLADIMAASSCFPGGFEPVNFPDDFVWPSNLDLSTLTNKKYPVGLMDGGIVDNQGIEPVLLAESRMKRNAASSEGNKPENALDLIILCEVASPNMEGFQASQQHNDKKWKRLSPRGLAGLNLLVLIVALAGIFFSFYYDCKIALMASTVLLTLSVLLIFISRTFFSLAASAGIPEEFLKPLGKLLKLKFFIYENLITNRFRSVMMLTMNVFLKHVRRLNYRQLYSDDTWKNRRIMSAIYELKSDEEQLKKKVEKGMLPATLMPSEIMCNNSDLASSMGTTLWFTKDELENKKMLDAIIACGQYTMCWNLLEYIHLIKEDNSNTNQSHQKLVDCEPQLLELWQKLLLDPKYLI